MFIHNGKLFSQIDGVAMGNPLGPTLAIDFLNDRKEIFDKHLSFFSIILCTLRGRCVCHLSIPQLKFKCS